MSALRKAVNRYLVTRRRLGFKLVASGYFLARFVAFMDRRREAYVTRDLAVDWSTEQKNVHRSMWGRRLSAVRQFAAFQIAFDPRTQIIPRDLLSGRIPRRQPYIYSSAEIGGLLEGASRLSSQRLGEGGHLRASTHVTLLGLIAVTGMRISEALCLERHDVDFALGLVHVRASKHGRERLVPLHPSTVEKLRSYGQLRDRVLPTPKTTRLFVNERGARLRCDSVYRVMHQVGDELGLPRLLRPCGRRSGPRIHDLRHRFAVETLIRWYRSGEDVEQKLPVLSTFLGHAKVSDTYWYLSGVPELLALATERLEQSRRIDLRVR
jgi:site-specific recombinase XerD